MYFQAPFIWISDQEVNEDVSFHSLIRNGAVRRNDGVNRWYLFRRQFDLPAVPDEAFMNVTVDGRYMLFVNGRFVGRGPCRSSPAFQRYDTHDVARHLNSGSNVIAFLVHVYGTDMAWYEAANDNWQSFFGDGTLYCDARMRCGTATIDLLSDTSWLWLEGRAWRRDTPRSGWGQDFIEDYDSRVMPLGWTDAGFDDSGWASCKIQISKSTAEDIAKGWGPLKPFPTLMPREIPALMEAPLAPSRHIAAYGVLPDPRLSIDRRIFDEKLIDLPDGLVDAPEALLSPNDSVTTIRTRDGCDVTMLLAFNRRHSGFPFIELDAQGGEIIELAVAETIPGEYCVDKQSQPRLARETYLDCAHLFRYVARPGLQRFQKFEWTAVKYVQLVVRNAPQGVKIRHVGSTYIHYPVENRGAFQCSDELLNRVWEVGRYTTLECMHDAFEDCPSREKRQWLGDAFIHYLVNAAAFGISTQAIDRQSLIQATESQRPDGLLQMFAPGDHHTNGIIIPDFNLHWVYAAHHYFIHTADIDAIEKIFPAMQRSLAWFERQLGPNGLLADLPYWHFIEWANVGRQGEAAIVNAMFVGALKAAAALARSLDYSRADQRYATLANRVTQAINDRLWDESRGVYVDMVDPASGKQHLQVSQHANAAMILWDIAPRPRWERMINRIMEPGRAKITAAPPVVPVGQTLDPEEDVVQVNTYFGHFLYSALGKAGRFDLALHAIRDYFRPMLDTGTETLWESFDPTASLCHAFSASAVYQLSAHALGVIPVAPGFKRFLLAPQLADLEYARGVYPTLKGDIIIDWTRRITGLELAIIVPEGAEAEIMLPEVFVVENEHEILSAGSHRINFKMRR